MDAKLDRFKNLSSMRVTKKPMACRKVLLEVPVKKPPNETWFRINTNQEYYGVFYFISLKADKEELYFVVPEVADALNGIESRLIIKHVFTCINRSGDVWLWATTVPDELKPNSWHASALECADKAKTYWTRIVANNKLKINEATISEIDSEFEWPKHTFEELLQVAFKGKIIDTMEHPVIRRLQGLE